MTFAGSDVIQNNCVRRREILVTRLWLTSFPQSCTNFVAEIDIVIEEEEIQVECTDREGVCTAELQTKLTLAGEKWLLTFFSEHCNHKRDYFRLMLIISLPLCVFWFFFQDCVYHDDYEPDCGPFLRALLSLVSSLLFPFFVYTSVFYYHLTGPPCHCFRPTVIYLGIVLFICALLAPIPLLVEILFVDSDYSRKSSRFKCPPYTKHVAALLFYFLFYWIMNDYFC